MTKTKFLNNMEEIISIELITPLYVENFGFLGITANSNAGLLLEKNNLSYTHKIELDLERQIAQKLVSKTNLAIANVNLTKVALVTQNKTDLLVLYCNANLKHEDTPIAIFFTYEQENKTAILSSIKSMKTFAKIDSHQFSFGSIYFNDSICFIYQRNLIETLESVINSNKCDICYIQNLKTSKIISNKNNKSTNISDDKDQSGITIWN